MTETMETIKKMVEESGTPVGIDEPVCVLWKTSHENCIGCASHLGCGKTAKLGMLMLIPLTYIPKDFNDFSQMMTRMTELRNLTLDAKTVDELHAIPDI